MGSNVSKLAFEKVSEMIKFSECTGNLDDSIKTGKVCSTAQFTSGC